MYWLQRPPYLRWAGAVALIVGAFIWDLSSSRTEPHPFARTDLEAGTPIGEAAVAWRSVPAGLFEAPDLEGTRTRVDVPAGEPLTRALLGVDLEIPEGWWAVPVDLAPGATPGSEVMLVITDPPLTVPGIVTAAARGDPFALDYRPATVAVPGDAAALVAAASRSNLLVTATRP